MKKLQANQSGAASLITVIFLAIILSIVTTGLLRLSVQDARQATDDDLTNRAFYAAESGINDALRFIDQSIADPTFDLRGDVCDTPEGIPVQLGTADLNTDYVCQLIDLEPSELINIIGEGDATQIDLDALPGPTNVLQIRWHRLAENPSTALRPSATSDELPEKSTWGDSPAMLRLNFFSTPAGGGFTRADINGTNSVFFVNPTSNAPAQTYTNTGTDGTIETARCTTDVTLYGGYACEVLVNITNFAGRDHTVRVSSIYTDTETNISFDDGRSIGGEQAIVDVTGRAADVYRRVRAAVSLETDSASVISEAAVQTVEDICKEITISTNVTYGNCGP